MRHSSRQSDQQVQQVYVLALGSNRAGRGGGPMRQIGKAISALAAHGVRTVAQATPRWTPPVGPSIRRFANGMVIVETPLTPPRLLALLKAIETSAGRRRGRRWGARVIDIDIILWSGGTWRDNMLTIPHPAFRSRGFVLDPLVRVAADWRDPITGRTVRQLRARKQAVDRCPKHP